MELVFRLAATYKQLTKLMWLKLQRMNIIPLSWTFLYCYIAHKKQI